MGTGLAAQAAVIGLPDPVMGNKIHALVRPAEGKTPTAGEILAACSKELPPHMTPRGVEFVEDFPRSPNGKVDYKKLRAERVRDAGEKVAK